jgi:hypothetical protein
MGKVESASPLQSIGDAECELRRQVICKGGEHEEVILRLGQSVSNPTKAEFVGTHTTRRLAL